MKVKSALLILFILLSGCSLTNRLEYKQPLSGKVRDVSNMPQNASAYINPETKDKPLIPAEKQIQLYFDFVDNHFAPWHRTEPKKSKDKLFWGAKAFKDKKLYGENKLPLPENWLKKMLSASNMEDFPLLSQQAITTTNTSMRVFPTQKPAFYDFRQAGEGFPFDYLQNSLLPIGTPLYVCHISKDRKWVLAESRIAHGWIPVKDIAWIDDKFRQEYETKSLGAVVQDNLPILSGGKHFLASGYIGTVLPFGGLVKQVLVPVRDARGNARISRIFMSENQIRPMPMQLTADNMSRLINKMLGQKYGWGGMFENRDCSATIMDIFTPFGIWLPRNSKKQAQIGRSIDLSTLSPEEKQKLITEQGKPFMTLIYKPGHIMLYLGRNLGDKTKPAIFHNLWGIKTKSLFGEGRYVVGRAVITSLEVGLEVDKVHKDALLLSTITQISFPLL